MHVVLLGDSIFDNNSYVGTYEPDVRNQLAALIRPPDKVTLLAVDGSVIENVVDQLRRLPDDATHLVISVGGNNLLLEWMQIKRFVSTTQEAFDILSKLADDFTDKYQRMLRNVLNHKLPTTVCTVYNPRFPDTDEQRMVVTALRTFNDCIIQMALEVGVPVIELRAVCSEDGDFANPIEPSAQGGQKIAEAVATVVKHHDFSQSRTTLYGS